MAHHRAGLPVQPLHLPLEMRIPKEGRRAQSHIQLASSSSLGCLPCGNDILENGPVIPLILGA